jgi:long-chain fatty acid transport protein
MLKRIGIAFVLMVAFVPLRPCWGGGFESFGIGARQLAMGGAATGLADDWRAIYWNPAGLAFLEGMAGGQDTRANFVEGWSSRSLKNVESPNRLLGDFQLVYPTEPREFRRTFDSTTVLSPDGGGYKNFGDWTLGGGAYGTAGTGSDWHDRVPTLNGDFLKAKYESDVFVLNVPFCVARKLTDTLSVGVAVSALYGESYRDVAKRYQPQPFSPFPAYDIAFTSDASGFGVSGDVGLLFKPCEELSMGIVYRTPFTMRLSGHADVTNTLAGAALTSDVVQRMYYPTRISAGVAVRPLERLVWTADVNWIDWTHLTINLNYDPESVFMADSRVDYDFKDTTAFRTGLEYLLPKGWAVRAGVFTDPSPYRDEWASVVTARFADACVVTVGVGKQVGSLSLDMLYGYAFTQRREVDGEVYDGKQNNFSVGVTFAF